jgi:hypothetical protein
LQRQSEIATAHEVRFAMTDKGKKEAGGPEGRPASELLIAFVLFLYG